MKIISHGQWSRYVPDESDTKRFRFSKDILFYKNDVSGMDFYEYRNSKFTDNTILACTRENGKIYEVSKGHMSVFPDGAYLWELVPEGDEDTDPRSYIGKWISLSTKKFKKDVVEVPSSIPAVQIKIAMHDYRASLYNLYNEVISTTDDIPMKIYFTDSIYWERSSQYVAKLTSLLGLKETEMDKLFVNATKIT